MESHDTYPHAIDKPMSRKTNIGLAGVFGLCFLYWAIYHPVTADIMMALLYRRAIQVLTPHGLDPFSNVVPCLEMRH